MAKERFKITPASYLVLEKDNKVLLLRRCNTGFQDGNYGLVSGHLDGGESFKEAMIREAKEEAGIILDINDLDVVHVLHRNEIFNDIGARERIDVFVKAKKWNGEVKNKEPNKCDDLSWFSLDNIPENTIPYIKHVLENINKNIFYSEFGFDKR
jgi:8-oxo-dGTP diphosphatase